VDERGHDATRSTHLDAILDGVSVRETEATGLQDVLGERRWLVLTGAGVSTDSGIPDYRGPGARVRSPMTIQQFRSGHAARQRYWARSFLGWSSMGTALPNATHRHLSQLEEQGRLSGLITQNVDGLHTAAGHRDLVELHGRIDRVICLVCGTRSSRAALQERLRALNPAFSASGLRSLPDGDVDLESTDGFEVAECERCAGVLKPDVVFFGESVPRALVHDAARSLEAADAMLVVGSSLMVYSGYRFCEWAAKSGKPIAAINIGKTRADALLALKVEAPCSEALERLIERLDARPVAG
jgi:NAD-dependent SIR2 family protein deacetylase